MPQDPLGPELEAVEAALSRLAPARSRLDRDQLMFQAGARSAMAGAGRRWAWPSVVAVLCCVVVAESAALATRPEPRVVIVRDGGDSKTPAVVPEPVRILVEAHPSPVEERTSRDLGGGEGLVLRRQVLRFGLEGLPDPPLLTQSGVAAAGADAVPESPRPLRRYELNKVFDMGGPS